MNSTDIFKAVQLSGLFKDSKTFIDVQHQLPINVINKLYLEESKKASFSLPEFIKTHFLLPEETTINIKKVADPKEHINNLWKSLTRETKSSKLFSSIIPLPNNFIVPGGRFREIYYWDSYFTMLGLRESKEFKTIENMVDNFAYLLREKGFIPNGNRTYYLGRSQPPFFSLMVELLESCTNTPSNKYLEELEIEYNFWMSGYKELNKGEQVNRVVRLSNGTILNRYYDNQSGPRPESYKEDIHLAGNNESTYLHIRAACESGWDFSTRWFEDKNDFSTIITTDILPVDLNALLFNLEKTLSKKNKEIGNTQKAEYYCNKAINRANAINELFFNDGFYYDFNWRKNQIRNSKTAAAAFPLFFNIASQDSADLIAQELDASFIKKGGLVTTLVNSGQQWDWPNGWAPLQWMAYIGLKNYGKKKLANKLKEAWLTTNTTVFKESGKFTEKYNVAHNNLNASGGEYPNQDGFGWTNGVYLALSKEDI